MVQQVFANGDAEPMAFHGRYLELAPPACLAWTSEEGAGVEEGTLEAFEQLAERLVALGEGA